MDKPPRKPNSGQFKKGNPGGPGGPLIRMPAAIRQARETELETFVTYSQDKIPIELLIDKLKELVEKGDIRAIELVLERRIGPVPRNINVKGHVHHTSESDRELLRQLYEKARPRVIKPE